jgi:short-subunit dehydrogenase
MTTRPVALITGASAGIGWELARVFASHGHELVLIARRDARLATLADEIAAKSQRRPLTLAVDLAQRDAAQRIGDALDAQGLEPQFIVNNAGFGLSGPARDLDRAEQLAMIDLNIRALTELSLAFVESLQRHKGGILNVASVAGFLPGPRMAVYFATKAYVVSFSEALHCELAPAGVRVCALCPGPVPTEFQVRAGIVNPQYPPLLTWSAARTAEVGYRGLMDGRRLVIPGVGNRAVPVLATLLPRRLTLAIMNARQRKRDSSQSAATA